ncbi:c-type cytochrome [Brucella intermedia]|uniref:c-type cytochrome n=1 Tax=Brucella intermedia TaxID=94625 RepID=UPI0021C85EC9|nr:cytochrome c family protein [Brucella intermedia]UXO83066.1 cytochrome c family protein [Brucella intermedia]WGJ06708.1 cytochrome c family protein [Brucella intermedia]
MNSTRTNKFIMAFLATVFVVMTTGILSDSLFHSPAPEKPGFAIEAAEASTGEGGAAPAKEEVSIATLLQSADPARGETVFKRCAACHTGEKGGANKVGPHLWDVVNRPAASVEGFGYSAAMKEFGAAGNKWDFEHLNKFLTSPKGFIKGTAMGFAGDKKDNERADLIAYLRTLSDNPAPLPTADAAPAAGGDAKPAEGEKPAEGSAPAGAPAGGEQKPAEPAPAN